MRGVELGFFRSFWKAKSNESVQGIQGIQGRPGQVWERLQGYPTLGRMRWQSRSMQRPQAENKAANPMPSPSPSWSHRVVRTMCYTVAVERYMVTWKPKKKLRKKKKI